MSPQRVRTSDSPPADVTRLIRELAAKTSLDAKGLAVLLGSSQYSVQRWLDGTAKPSPAMQDRICEHLSGSLKSDALAPRFASTGAVGNGQGTLFTSKGVRLMEEPTDRVIDSVTDGVHYVNSGDVRISDVIGLHAKAAHTADVPPPSGMSAGKNTYTYDAHTYHTKVPPQGIAELLRHYLPDGGLVLDPFAGSGMTGVAASFVGSDAILNELSPAACFISSQFTSKVDPTHFASAIAIVTRELHKLRERLYTTTCRECGVSTEIIYTVWSYRVLCSACDHEFNIWDVARRYGETVREHKILSEFDCPECQTHLKKSKLDRTVAEPVELTYRCCGRGNFLVHHPLLPEDVEVVKSVGESPALVEGFYPTTGLPHGVNLGQPRRHGLDSINKFYTPRNLSAMSQLWYTIHRIEDRDLRALAAFTLTSLYLRVTRLSEFRFWGGSGNLARLNIPFIFKEANVFDTFERKAKSVADHLETTASKYSGDVAVREGSATDLSEVPDESIDLIFTDPPFGANINYSEVNLLWEAWLGRFTDTKEEAIVNKVQGKGVKEYGQLMAESLKESYRVLRPGHWMLVVFMNSSGKIWEAVHEAIVGAGFDIHGASVFDKQHGTFKQFVSENTPGADLVLHCHKPSSDRSSRRQSDTDLPFHDEVSEFLSAKDINSYAMPFLHVKRETEIDYRRLYSEWVAHAVTRGQNVIDFSEFREICEELLNG